jgi:four helix bundle protein
MRNFRKYDLWTDSISFVTDIYGVTKDFPSYERFGLSDQLQRAAVSIASNIAEGSSRSSEKEFCHFLRLSIGSAFEVETQLIIANNLGYIQNSQLEKLLQELHSIERRLNEMINILGH